MLFSIYLINRKKWSSLNDSKEGVILKIKYMSDWW